jgi:hypothetical protein
MQKGRYALVVGNGSYQRPPIKKLRNPVNDATRMAKALDACGYQVTDKYDLDADSFSAAIDEFENESREAAAAIIFYSGHGIASNGKNYLLPTDAQLLGEVDLTRFMSVEGIIERIAKTTDKTVFLFDACRNTFESAGDTFDDDVQSSEPRKVEIGGATYASGMTTASLPVNLKDLFIFFATSPDSVARDGVGENSPFTHALLENITIPGLKIGELANRVYRSVRSATQKSQRPWPVNLMSGAFYVRDRTFLPVLIFAGLGLLSGYVSGFLHMTDRLNLDGVKLLPGLMFALAMIAALKLSNIKAKLSIVFVAIMIAWVAANSLYGKLSDELPKAIERSSDTIAMVRVTEQSEIADVEQQVTESIIDRATADERIEEIRKKSGVDIVKSKQSLEFLRENGTASIGFLAGLFGALATVAGFAFASVRAQSKLYGVLAALCGGFSVVAAGAYAKFFGEAASQIHLAYLLWQGSVACCIGLGIAVHVPSQDNWVYRYVPKTPLGKENILILCLAAMSAIVSSILMFGAFEVLKPVATVLEYDQVPMAPSLAFGAALCFLVWSKTGNAFRSVLLFVATSIAWYLACKSLPYMRQVSDNNFFLYGGAGAVGSFILISAGAALFEQLRRWINFALVPFLGIICTVPFVTVGILEWFSPISDRAIRETFEFATLFSPWQIAIAVAFISAFDKENQTY